MPPDWTPGCSLKLKYSSGIAHNTDNDQYCNEEYFSERCVIIAVFNAVPFGISKTQNSVMSY